MQPVLLLQHWPHCRLRKHWWFLLGYPRTTWVPHGMWCWRESTLVYIHAGMFFRLSMCMSLKHRRKHFRNLAVSQVLHVSGAIFDKYSWKPMLLQRFGKPWSIVLCMLSLRPISSLHTFVVALMCYLIVPCNIELVFKMIIHLAVAQSWVVWVCQCLLVPLIYWSIRAPN